MKFEELDLNDNILDALYDMRFDGKLYTSHP